jgi:hypothetical protein
MGGQRWDVQERHACVAAQGTGLSEKQVSLCDAFVYIPQYGAGTASLNVTVAASIVLQHFAAWAGYPERSRHGAKFDVGVRPERMHARGMPNKGVPEFWLSTLCIS